MSLLSRLKARWRLFTGQAPSINPRVQFCAADETLYVCRCGHSRQRPFCDAASPECHERRQAFSVEHDHYVHFCICGNSQQWPRCDGSHNQRNEARLAEKQLAEEKQRLS